jgi:hypothetical protein
VKNDGKIEVRVPKSVLAALEIERRRMSRAAGAEVKMSALVRALISEGVRSRRISGRKARAA